uniref:Uncharacterized protein n=1 Tax=Arundo donax TaxID=35708 RepID=A0A0A9BCT0_ARUDO
MCSRRPNLLQFTPLLLRNCTMSMLYQFVQIYGYGLFCLSNF